MDRLIDLASAYDAFTLLACGTCGCESFREQSARSPGGQCRLYRDSGGRIWFKLLGSDLTPAVRPFACVVCEGNGHCTIFSHETGDQINV